MKTNSKIQTVNVNTVANYNEAHAISIGMRKKTGTISQQAKALGGIGEEYIEVTIGKGEERKKIRIKEFIFLVELPVLDGRKILEDIAPVHSLLSLEGVE